MRWPILIALWRAITVLAALWCSARFAPLQAAERTLDVHGLGTLHLGMSVRNAERALGSKLRAQTGSRTDPCHITIRADGVDPGISYMLEAGRVTRIDIMQSGRDVPAVATKAGIRIGSTLADVRRAYGARIKVQRHPISGQARWVLVRNSRAGGIRLELTGGTVTEMWAAVEPALSYPEGCS